MAEIPGYDGEFWADLKGDFLNHVDFINAKLGALGRQLLGRPSEKPLEG